MPLSKANKFVNILLRVFPADGVDLVNETLNGSEEDFQSASGKKFIYDPLSLLTTFLGLPNRQLNTQAGQSWLNIAKNFIGWQDNVSSLRNTLNAIFFIPLNLLTTPVKFLTNCIKVISELIPGFVSQALTSIGLALLGYCIESIFEDLLKSFSENKKILSKAIIILKCAVLMSVGLAFFLGGIFSSFLTIFGRAITSPIESAREAWKTGIESGKLGAIICVGLSVAFSAAAYAAVFPLAIKLLSATVIPYLANHLPVAVTQLCSRIAQAATPLFEFIGKVSQPFVNTVTNIFTWGLFKRIHIPPMPAASGLGLATGVFTSTVGTGIERLTTSFRNWWHKKSVVLPSSTPDLQPQQGDVVNENRLTNSTENINAQLANLTSSVNPQSLSKEDTNKPIHTPTISSSHVNTSIFNSNANAVNSDISVQQKEQDPISSPRPQ